eukprot:1341548-Amorphochlora_amoeboformis.AAC.3
MRLDVNPRFSMAMSHVISLPLLVSILILSRHSNLPCAPLESSSFGFHSIFRGRGFVDGGIRGRSRRASSEGLSSRLRGGKGEERKVEKLGVPRGLPVGGGAEYEGAEEFSSLSEGVFDDIVALYLPEVLCVYVGC